MQDGIPPPPGTPPRVQIHWLLLEAAVLLPRPFNKFKCIYSIRGNELLNGGPTNWRTQGEKTEQKQKKMQDRNIFTSCSNLYII